MQDKVSNLVQNTQLQPALALEAVMAKTATNPVAQVLQHQGEFYEWRDYPQGGVWDRASGFGYFYHSHPGTAFAEEHGHFHLFWANDPSERLNLAALSMDSFGRLIGAFIPNVWHCDVANPHSTDLSSRYSGFGIQLAFPCFATNQWLTQVVRGFSGTLTSLHQRAGALILDPVVSADRGRAVLVHTPLDLRVTQQKTPQAAVKQSLKQVRR